MTYNKSDVDCAKFLVGLSIGSFLGLLFFDVFFILLIEQDYFKDTFSTVFHIIGLIMLVIAHLASVYLIWIQISRLKKMNYEQIV